MSGPRVVWRKELIPSPPTWVGQALRNNIQYKQTIDTYRTLGEDFNDGGKPDNNAPVAVNDAETTTVGSAVSINVLGNDSDSDGDVLTIISIDEQSVNGGTVVDNGSGVLTYTPPAGFVGKDTFTYTISDGHGGEATATVSITIEAVVVDPDPVNIDPVAVNDSASTTVDKQVPINVLGNDTDANGNTLTVSGFDATSVHGGTVTNNSGQLIYTPPAGFVGTDTFTYTISDGKGGSATATVTVIVSADPVPVDDLNAQDDSVTTHVNTSVDIDVLSNDSDPDGDLVLINSFDSTSQGNGSVTENADGLLVYTPAADFTGTDTFTYTATDGDGEVDSATVTITVTNSTDPDPDPTPHNKPAPDDYAVDSGSTLLPVLSNDTYDGSVTIQIITHPGKGNIQNESNGDVSGTNVEYVPQSGATGTDTFTYALVDGDGLVSDPVTVTITLPNGGGSGSCALSAADDGTVGELLGDAYSIYPGDTMTRELDVLGNDQGCGLTIVEIVSGPRFGTAQISSDGKYINYTLRSGYCEDHTFVYRVRDENGNETEATVHINVID